VFRVISDAFPVILDEFRVVRNTFCVVAGGFRRLRRPSSVMVVKRTTIA